MWFDVKHRNLALLSAFVCVLAGSFGMGDEPNERIFRNRTRHTRAGHTQCHVVLDSVHEECASAFATGRHSGASSSSSLPQRVIESHAPFAGFEMLTLREVLPPGSVTVSSVRGRAPPPSFL
jgi:hypothetical protein